MCVCMCVRARVALGCVCVLRGWGRFTELVCKGERVEVESSEDERRIGVAACAQRVFELVVIHDEPAHISTVPQWPRVAPHIQHATSRNTATTAAGNRKHGTRIAYNEQQCQALLMGTVGTVGTAHSVLWHTTAQSRPTCAPTGRWHGTNHGQVARRASHARVPTYRRTNASARARTRAHATAVRMYRRALHRQSGARARVGVRMDSRARAQPRVAGERASIGRRSGFRVLRAFGGSKGPVVCALEKAEPHRRPVAFPPLHLPALPTRAQPEHTAIIGTRRRQRPITGAEAAAATALR